VSAFTRSTASGPRSLTTGGAELARERDPLGVAAEDDDLLCVEPLGGDHAAEADGAVADDGCGLARADASGDGRVVAGAHHVRER
jgi:hypothetical protein